MRLTEICHTWLVFFSFPAFKIFTFIYTRNTKEYSSRIKALKTPERKSSIDVVVSLSETQRVDPRIWIQVSTANILHSYALLVSLWKWRHIHNLQIFHAQFISLVVVEVPKQKLGLTRTWWKCIIKPTYTGCFTTLGNNCRRWFPRFLWSKKLI